MRRQDDRTDTTDAKATLLARAVELAAANGLSDVSLRQMALALGTSHRMLIYHFGSKEGLLVAVINEMEQRQLQTMAALDGDRSLSPAEQVRAMWKQVSDPALWPHERLFFEVYGQALQGRPHAVRLLDTVVESWLEPATRMGMRHGASRRTARAHARLSMAVVRGLLLDLLATGDRQGCDAALERYLATVP